MKRAFVIGHPITHSRSPLIHGYWLKEHGIDARYDAIDVAPADLETFIKGLRENGFVGGNVTIPHKQGVVALCDRVSDQARRIGAVNTLYFEGGALIGDNTDAMGFWRNVEEFVPRPERGRAIVLGAGGAARAVVVALLDEGFTVEICNRTFETAVQLASGFTERVTARLWDELPTRLREAVLLVNTTSLGMRGHPPLDIDLVAMPRKAIVADIVYVPLETPLLSAAKARGMVTVGGLGMLLHQAVPGFRRWFGVEPVVTPKLRALIEADIARSL